MLPEHIHLVLADYPRDDKAIQMTATAVAEDVDVIVWKLLRLPTHGMTRGKMNDMMLARRRKTVNDATTEHDMMNVERTVDAKR